jgi:four helix bundle protein
MRGHRYEDLAAWQLANELKEQMYDLIDNSPARNDFEFRDQIKDSSSSAPANISEGFGYYYHKQFARHVRIARASAMETHNHLGDGVKRGHWTEEKVIPRQQLAKRAIGAATGPTLLDIPPAMNEHSFSHAIERRRPTNPGIQS